MGVRQVVQLVDDLDGGVATETVRFALDGVDYTADLSEANAAALRELLSEYAAAGRRVTRPRLAGNPRRHSRRTDTGAPAPQLTAVPDPEPEQLEPAIEPAAESAGADPAGSDPAGSDPAGSAVSVLQFSDKPRPAG